MLHCDNLGKDILIASAYLGMHAPFTRGTKYMPHLATSAVRRSMIILLSDAEIAQIARMAEEIDAADGETLDLLPLGALLRLTERSRAA
jgi:hypothetical protein